MGLNIVKNNRLHSIFCFLVFIIIGLTGNAQGFKADFSVNDASGCAPHVVKFTNLSTGVGPNTVYNWYVGTNSSPFTETDPQVTYIQGGDYTVKLIIRDGNQVDSIIKTAFIRVFSKPAIRLSINPSVACTPAQVQFNDLTSNAKIVSWVWNFGNGSANPNTPNPLVTYTEVRSYDIFLQVVDSNGCRADTLVKNGVTIKKQPDSTFTSTPPIACKPPLKVSFTADETDPAFTYKWTIESIGELSGRQINDVEFTSTGTYDVTLEITGPGGCTSKRTIKDYVVIQNPVAAITVPALGCKGVNVAMSNNSTNTDSTFWTFGDGSNGVASLHTNHTYGAEGIYTVRMIATSNKGACADTAFRTIEIQDPKADFVPLNVYSCTVPFKQYFQSTSTGAATYLWTPSGGTAARDSMTFTNEGNFTVKLEVTSSGGCKSSKTTTVKISKPKVKIVHDDVAGGCAPLLVNFLDKSTSDSAIVRWNWNFGDGQSSPLQNPSHTYTAYGTYTVVLEIENKLGCQAIDSVTLIVGEKPIVNFMFQQSQPCAWDDGKPVIELTDLSYPASDPTKSDPENRVDFWQWTVTETNGSKPDSVKGDLEIKRFDQNPEYFHRNTVGYINVELIAGINGCLDTLNMDSLYYIFGPIIPKLSATVPCGERTIDVFAEIADFHHLELDFGDHHRDTLLYYYSDTVITPVLDPVTFAQVGQDTIVLNPFPQPAEDFVDTYDNHQNLLIQHTYKNPGTYYVKIKAVMDTTKFSPFKIRGDSLYDPIFPFCIYEDSVKIVIADFQALIEGPDSVCKSSKPLFIAKDPGSAVAFQWLVNGTQVATTQSYTNPSGWIGLKGTYTIQLIVTDPTGCKDTATHLVTVLEPKPVITLPGSQSITGCAPLALKFNGSDTSNVPIESWQWSFGNAAPNSFLQNPDTVRFMNVGTYSLKLTTTDIYKCQGTVFLTVTVSNSNPSFRIDTNMSCMKDTIYFINTSTPAGGSFEWILSTGDTLREANPAYLPDTFGVFTVKLRMSLGAGCQNETAPQTFTIDPMPVADFRTDSATVSLCYPYPNINFVALVSPQTSGYTYKWDLDGSIGGDSIVFGGYSDPGSYDISLIVTSPLGLCRDTVTKAGYIQVFGPTAQLRISDDTICVKDQIIFEMINPVNVESFQWDFGDGTQIDTSQKVVTTHKYTNAGVWIPILTFRNGNCEISIDTMIYVNDVVANFTLPNESPDFIVGWDTLKGCNTYDLLAIYDPGQGNIDQFTWKKFDGDVPNSDTTQTHSYSIGTYILSLDVSDNASGCSDFVRQVIQVFPPGVADAGPDYQLCPSDDSITVVGGPGVVKGSYLWTPSAGLSNADSRVVKADPAVTTEYVLLVTDSNGCFARDTMLVFRDQTSVAFSINDKEECGSLVLDVVNSSVANHYFWTFDNKSDNNAVPVYTFTVPGRYPVTLTAYDSIPRCGYTVTDTVEVYAIPSVSMLKDSMVCLGSGVFLNAVTDASPLVSFTWDPPSGLSDPQSLNPSVVPSGPVRYILTVRNEHCENSDTTNLDTDNAVAGFTLADSSFCQNGQAAITNTSSGGNYYEWQFSNLPTDTSTAFEPQFAYSGSGNFVIRQIVRDSLVACQDTAFHQVMIFPPPVLTVGPGAFICNYASHQLTATGGVTYDWTPGYELSDSTISNPLATPDTTTWYVVEAFDANGCSSKDSILVEVQPDFNYLAPPEIDTVVIGESVQLDVTADGPGVTYTWTPDLYLSCTTCPDPIAQPMEDMCYVVRITDDRNCYPKTDSICIVVDKRYTVDVPSAFTPNKDGHNDRIYVRGHGIRKLINFTIYNRWGEVVFETSDISIGWDGIYKDKLQNDETYVFTVNAEMYNGQVMTRNGYISLLK